MKKFLILCIVLFSFNLLIMYLFFDFKQKTNALVESYENRIDVLLSKSNNFEVLKKDLSLYNSNDNLIVNSNLLVTGIDGEKKNLGLIIKKPTLIVRYSYTNCDACVNFQLKMLIEFIVRFGGNNIVFLTSNENLREMVILRNSYNLNCSIYNVDENILNIVDERNEPYFFVLDTDFKTKHLFIPHKEMPEITFTYLEVIFERYFSL